MTDKTSVDDIIGIVKTEEPTMTDEDCDKIIELCWWHLGTCKLADCIIDSCDIMRGDMDDC